MASFEFMLFSLNQSMVVKFEGSGDVEPAVASFILNFAFQLNQEEKRCSINSLQSNTNKLHKKVLDFIENAKDVSPQINKLGPFISKLYHGEYFYILPNVKLESAKILDLGNQLIALNTNVDLTSIQDKYSLIFADLFDNYDLHSFNGQDRVSISVSDKAKRKCRFCGKDALLVQFKKKAHAISEALGNKGIICNKAGDIQGSDLKMAEI